MLHGIILAEVVIKEVSSGKCGLSLDCVELNMLAEHVSSNKIRQNILWA